MNSETINLLIGGIFGIISGLVINHFSFNKEKNYNHRIRTAYLLETLRKAVGQCNRQVTRIDETIVSTEKNIYDIPQIRIDAFPAIDLMAALVIKEDYYSSFMHIYKPIIKPKQKFFELEYDSVYLSGQLKEIILLFENARNAHHNRKKNFVAEYENIMNEIETNILRANPNRNPEESARLNAITQIITRLHENRNSLSDIPELYNLAIEPLIALDRINRLPTELALHINKAFHIYHDIEFQNKAFLENLKSLQSSFKSNTDGLNKIKNFFDKNMIKQFSPL